MTEKFAPNFKKFAITHGIKCKTISAPEEVSASAWLWNTKNKNDSVLLQAMIDIHTYTYPKIAFGKQTTEMEPFSKPIEMKGLNLEKIL